MNNDGTYPLGVDKYEELLYDSEIDAQQYALDAVELEYEP